jgi:hypothetical protein
MFSRKFAGSSLTVLFGAAAMLLAATTAEAAMAPPPGATYSSPDVQLAWCAAGLHVGPVGACIGGGPGPRWRGPYHRCWINRWGRRVCN